MRRRITNAGRERLEWLRQKNHGRLTPALVVRDARNPKSPLHKDFDWNLERAAYRHWIERARELIAGLSIEYTTTHGIVRGPVYVHDPTAPVGEQGYLSVEVVRGDVKRARQILTDECLRVVGSLRRARTIAEILNLEAEVDHILESLDGLVASVAAK